MKLSLEQRVARQLDTSVDPAIASFGERLARESDGMAVLFYGSNLRTGSLEGVIDYYVITPGPQAEKIWPRVSYREWEHAVAGADETLRAKIATMSIDKFTQAARGASIDTTIWARFVQPSALVWYRDDAARQAIAGAIADAAKTAARFAAALGPETGVEGDYWRALFRETYKAEFRVEKPGREDSILALNPAHFDGLLTAAWDADGIGWRQDAAGDGITVLMDPQRRAKVRRDWARARRMGKPLNITRLVKASTTFDGAARYAAWKIERHTGIPVAITPWREKHPVLAAPGVLLSLWRQKRGRQG